MHATTSPRPSLTVAASTAPARPQFIRGPATRPRSPREMGPRSTSSLPAAAAAAPSTHTKPVFALDFDGVACDSVGESATSAWIASERLWPEIFADPAVQAKKEAFLDSMRVVRPVIETGYENLVQVRCLVEGATVEAMLEGWPAMLDAKMKEWGLDRGDVS